MNPTEATAKVKEIIKAYHQWAFGIEFKSEHSLDEWAKIPEASTSIDELVKENSGEWEYDLESESVWMSDAKLNDKGKQGWELCGCFFIPKESGYVSRYLYYFKKLKRL